MSTIQVATSQLYRKYQDTLIPDIQEIMSPVLRFLPIKFFSQVRAFRNGGYTTLDLDTRLIKYYLKKQYPLCYNVGHSAMMENGLHVMEYERAMLHSKRKQEIIDHFNLTHFLCMVDKNDQYDDIYFFASLPQNRDFINQMINNVETIKHFILYFKDKTTKLLNGAPVLQYSCEHRACNEHKKDRCNIQLLKNDNLKEAMSFKKINVNVNNKKVILTAREYESLKLFLKGLTQKEIGRYCNLSPRTVETYLNNAKMKLNIFSTPDLLKLFENNYLLSHL